MMIKSYEILAFRSCEHGVLGEEGVAVVFGVVALAFDEGGGGYRPKMVSLVIQGLI